MKYVIVDYPPTQEQLDVVKYDGISPIRLNVQGTKCVLKYPWPKPAVFVNEQEYTYEEISIEVAKPEWNLEVE